MKQFKLDKLINKSNIPSGLYSLSPVWRIKGKNHMYIIKKYSYKETGLDVHQHTPVKVLHVVLLGFVKYLWCNVMKRISKIQKPLLMARLSSLDVRGLGILPVAGKTFIQYAGSLV